MQQTILAISGKPGLYKLVTRGKNNLIVESLDASHHRMPAFASERITSLNDIAMFTDDEDVPLMDILESMKTLEDGKRQPSTPRKPPQRNYRTTSRRCYPRGTVTVSTLATSRNSSAGITYSLKPASPTSKLKRKKKQRKLRT